MNFKHRNILVALMLIITSISTNAQTFLLTKTVLDSLKPYTFHGAARMSLEFKQTDSRSFQFNAGAEFMVPTNHHQFNVSGSFVYNLLDFYSNDNKGYVCLKANIMQFNLQQNKREKNLAFAEIYTSYNYDYIRSLHDRVMIGANAVFQPLRNHQHLCVEPGIGLLFSYQNWMVLNDGNGHNSLDYFLADYDLIKDKRFSDGTTVQDYLQLKSNGRKEQIDMRLALNVNFMGSWDKISFSTYLMMQQPFSKPFKDNPRKQEELKQILRDTFPDAELTGVPVYNTKCAPEILFGANFSVKIWKMLSLVTSFDLFYDAGQLPNTARNLTYVLSQGLSVVW